MDRSLEQEGREKDKEDKFFGEVVGPNRCDAYQKAAEHQGDSVGKPDVLYGHSDAGCYSEQGQELDL